MKVRCESCDNEVDTDQAVPAGWWDVIVERGMLAVENVSVGSSGVFCSIPCVARFLEHWNKWDRDEWGR